MAGTTGARTRDLRRERPKAPRPLKRISQLTARIVLVRWRPLDVFRPATVRATVVNARFMPVLAYNDECARNPGTTAQVDLAGRLAQLPGEFPARGSAQARFRAVPGSDRTTARERQNFAWFCRCSLAGACG